MITQQGFKQFCVQLLALFFCAGFSIAVLAQPDIRVELSENTSETGSRQAVVAIVAVDKDSVSSVAAIPSMSVASETPSQLVTLETSDQEYYQPVGECEVVNGILAGYCASNPDDISCHIL